MKIDEFFDLGNFTLLTFTQCTITGLCTITDPGPCECFCAERKPEEDLDLVGYKKFWHGLDDA